MAHQIPDGKGNFEVHRIAGPQLSVIDDGSVDVVFAHGVMEHLSLEEIFDFIMEFFRILRPQGLVSFNFGDLMSDAGLDILRAYAHSRRLERFRLHHPESIVRVAEAAGSLIFAFDRRMRGSRSLRWRSRHPEPPFDNVVNQREWCHAPNVAFKVWETPFVVVMSHATERITLRARPATSRLSA